MTHNGYAAYKEAQAQEVDQAKLILMMFSGSINYLDKAIEAAEFDLKEMERLVSKAKKVILELIASLNIEDSGEIGEMLLKMGYISQDTLRELIHQQIREVVFDLLSWGEGDFEYQDCSVEFNDQLIDNVNAFQLLLESTVRKDELLVAG